MCTLCVHGQFLRRHKLNKRIMVECSGLQERLLSVVCHVKARGGCCMSFKGCCVSQKQVLYEAMLFEAVHAK